MEEKEKKLSEIKKSKQTDEKSEEISPELSAEKNEFAEKLALICENLFYLSETDAEIKPFFGQKAEQVTPENLLKQIGKEVDSPIEIREIPEFFRRLTETHDWFGDEEKAIAEKFAKLQEILTNKLKDAKIIKVGKIRIDIFMVGLDSESRLIGVQTKAVET